MLKALVPTFNDLVPQLQSHEQLKHHSESSNVVDHSIAIYGNIPAEERILTRNVGIIIMVNHSPTTVVDLLKHAGLNVF